MKKLLLLALAAAGAVVRTQEARGGQAEQALWAEATDTVDEGLIAARPTRATQGPWRNW